MTQMVKNRSSSRAISSFALLSLCICLQSCAGKGGRAKLYAAPKTPFKAVAVFPAKIKYDKQSIAEEIHRSADVLSALWKHSHWLSIAPSQFRVIDEQEKSALHGTDIIRAMKKLKLKRHEMAYLRTTLSSREKTGSARIKGKLGVKIGKEYDIKIIATLELYTLDGELVAESEAIVTHDPFGEYEDYDQKPAAREAVSKALISLVEKCDICFEEAFRAEYATVESPAMIMHANTIDNESFIQELAKTDPLERDFRLLLAMQYFLPSLTLAQSKMLSKSPAGFCFQEEAKEPFKPFECITHINNKEIGSIHELSQARPDLHELKLKAITRDGKTRTIILPLN